MSVRIALVLAISFVLAACASQDGGEARIPSGGSDCFWANNIHNWKTMDDQTLIVWSPNRSCPYLVELSRRCLGIRFTEDLVFYDRDGRICPFGGDAVIVPGTAGDRCSIASIRKLSSEELEILLADELEPGDLPLDVDDCTVDPDN
jgi:hypothetical protein